jgi:hypothetical protein
MRYILGHVNRQRPVIEEASPFKIDGVYCRIIPLTNNLWAIVDASDYEWLMQWKWCARWSKCTRSFYAIRGSNHKTIYMNRVILGLDENNPHKGDHENHNTLDNRRSNLRIASSEENSRNARLRRDSSSGCKGVNWHKWRGMWVARIMVNKKSISLGYFHVFEEAKAAYEKAALELHGDFANFG